jgi:hypothetical protein
MKKIPKLILFGLLTWIIPFAISFFFYSKDGQPLINIFLFKSIMILVGAVVGVLLLVLYFKDLKKDFFKEGIIVGAAWFAINAALDIVILIPISGMSIGVWFQQIGLRYLIIPIISISMGYVKNQ